MSFVTNYDLIVEFFVGEGCLTVGRRHRLVSVTSTCNLKNRDQLLGKVPKYSRHVVAKL